MEHSEAVAKKKNGCIKYLFKRLFFFAVERQTLLLFISPLIRNLLKQGKLVVEI